MCEGRRVDGGELPSRLPQGRGAANPKLRVAGWCMSKVTARMHPRLKTCNLEGYYSNAPGWAGSCQR